MKFTITGSLGNISKPLAEILIASGHQVTIVSSDAEKRSAIEALGATAAIGSIEDTDFLTAAFSGADAVYTMVPPNFQATNWKEYIAWIGKNYAEAIKRSGITNVLSLSSIGAHLPEAAGPVSGLYQVEQALNALENVNIVFLRPGFFYTNFYSSAGSIKNNGIMAGNYGENERILMVHPSDIAKAAAAILAEIPFKGKTIRYVVSDIRTTNEIAGTIGNAIGNPGLLWINASDDDALNAMIQSGLSREIAVNYVEMGKAVRDGKLFKEFDNASNSISEKTSLENFAKEFAANI